MRARVRTARADPRTAVASTSMRRRIRTKTRVAPWRGVLECISVASVVVGVHVH
jgi:hypothetical protein